MAYGSSIGADTTVDAAADLSAKQFYFVLAAGTLCGKGGKALGVLQNTPKSGEAASVRYGGISKVVYGGTVAVDGDIASDANGKAVTPVAASGDRIVGKALEAGVAGDIGTIVFIPGGAA